MGRFNRIAGTAAVIGLVVCQPAAALTFVLNDTGGTAAGTQARQGFDIAAAYWSSVFTDNITVRLNIGFQSLSSGILGQTGSAMTTLSMTQTYNALAADRTSVLDTNAVASLRPLVNGSVSAITNGFRNGTDAGGGYTDASTRVDSDGSINNAQTSVTQASAKALGLTTDVDGRRISYSATDGVVVFSSNYSFDFNPSDGVSSGSFDFIGIAIHEIGHALGFVSGVDDYDDHTGTASVAPAAPSSLEGTAVVSQLDLFRYSSSGKLDWSTQNDAYFSVDGGASQYKGDSLFSTGATNGDGRQASHWKDGLDLGIMDPTAAPGEMLAVTGLDLGAFDAIGWNLDISVRDDNAYRETTANIYRRLAAPVPEPASWAMMILGLGAVGGGARYRRRRLAVRYA